MTEDEYLEGEFPEDDDDILEAYLIEEPDDITHVLMPKIEFHLEDELEKYYKFAKQCRKKEDIKQVFRMFYSHITSVTVLQHEIQYLQDRAKELEFNINMMRNNN